MSKRANVGHRLWSLALLAPMAAAIAVSGAARPAAAAACGATEAPDEAAALNLARSCATRVEVAAERTERARLFITPEGNRTLETSVVAQRARRFDGTWTEQLSDALVWRDGALVPAASAAHVKFSGGGDGPFASYERDGHTLTLTWPGTLPTPVVQGAQALYPEVLPGIDLVVRATGEGFAHELSVKTRAAAQQRALRELRLRVGGDAELASTVDGGLTVRAGGQVLAVAAPAVMWDSAQAVVVKDLAQTEVVRRRTDTRKVSRVTTRVAAGELVLTPDAALLDDPAAVFPIVVDPTFTEQRWTYANSTDITGVTSDPVVQSGESGLGQIARVGLDPGDGKKIRSFFEFPTSSSGGDLRGKHIISAQVTGVVDHTWACGDGATTNYFWRSGAISATPRQNWPGPALSVLLGSVGYDSANEDSCPKGNKGFEVAATADVQTAANGNWSTYTVAATAASSSSGSGETTDTRWARLVVNQMKLVVTYNTAPTAPTALTVDSKACASGTSRPLVPTLTPTLRANVSDPDGNSLTVHAVYAKWNGTSFVDVANLTQASVPSGTVAVITTPALVSGGIYQWRAYSVDAYDTGATSAGSCEFEVDTTAPVVPVVAGDVYTDTGCAPVGCGSIGQTGSFTFTSSADVTSFKWGFTSPPATVANAASAGAPVTVGWTPATAGAQTLFVQAIDKAGLASTVKNYQFNVAQPSIAVARWRLNEGAGTTLADDMGSGRSLALSGGTLGTLGRIVGDDTALTFDGVDDTASRVSTLDTSRAYSVAAWVRLTDSSVDRTAVSQAGTSNSAFQLQYDKDTNRWNFVVASKDGSGVTYLDTKSATVPKLGVWTHLTGVFEPVSQKAYLYVNGVLEATSTGAVSFNATSSLYLGRGGSSYWKGDLSDVRLFNRVLAATEITPLAAAVLTGRWSLEEVGPGPSYDSGNYAHDLDFYGGAQIPPGAGHPGSALRLDGLDDYASTSGGVLRTDQSFTVSAWVKLASTTGSQTILTQDAANFFGFQLYYRTNNGGEWTLAMRESDDSTSVKNYAAAPATNVVGVWHHVIGVFDAQAGQLRIYVDGTTLGGSANQIALWNATGSFVMGQNSADPNRINFLNGDIDEVSVYQGVVTDLSTIQ